ncbi:hypothetical protein GCM10010420_01280 [Streptomyces glaucosporus]|uniref:Uncharacterized protein n=1 Tax=Streptomyces glaucosporus TaxID=284044 RepID=A0ABN3HL26_9ACTN
MGKQRLAAALIAAAVLTGLGSTAALARGQAGDRGPERTAVTVHEDRSHAAPAEAATAPGVRVVRPYEPVEIGQGALLGLLPEGRQNYVVDWSPEGFRESVRRAKGYVGDDIRPNSLSGGLHYSPERGSLFTGAWRSDTVPARITVRTADGTFDAGILRLPGNPGWGAYHLDAGRTDARKAPVTVTAYAPDGTVIDDLVMDFPTR